MVFLNDFCDANDVNSSAIGVFLPVLPLPAVVVQTTTQLACV